MHRREQQPRCESGRWGLRIHVAGSASRASTMHDVPGHIPRQHVDVSTSPVHPPMRVPRVPVEVIAGVAELPVFLAAACVARRIPPETAAAIESLLPPALRRAPCFLDRLTRMWRYDFGAPFVRVGGRSTVVGTHMWQPVSTLLDVLVFVHTRLSTGERDAYLARLDDEAKHEHTLVECAPVLRIDADLPVQHDAPGYGVGETTIDWILGDRASPSLLLEVKHRSRDLLEQLARIADGETDADGTAPAPTHDHDLLFRSVEHKFVRNTAPPPFHAVWVCSNLAQEELALAEAFAKLDAGLVHCVLLGDWDDDVYVLAHDASIASRILCILDLRRSRRFVFSRAI